jgi:hypothetical protein
MQIDVFNKNGKTLEKLRLGPFANQKDSKYYFQDSLLNDKNWNNLKKDLEINGEIEYIDSINIKSKNIIQENRSKNTIEITGWVVISKKHVDLDPAFKIRKIMGISEKNPRPDGVYVFIDEHINSKVNYGKLRDDIRSEYADVSQRNSGWNGVIDLQGLSDKCHDVSIRVVLGDQYNEIKSKSQICILTKN